MSRYVDVEAIGIGRADPDIFENPEYAHGWNAAITLIVEAPIADVARVKHGEWVKEVFSRNLTCSSCRSYWIQCDEAYDFTYCPHCGAKMEEEFK